MGSAAYYKVVGQSFNVTAAEVEQVTRAGGRIAQGSSLARYSEGLGKTAGIAGAALSIVDA